MNGGIHSKACDRGERSTSDRSSAPRPERRRKRAGAVVDYGLATREADIQAAYHLVYSRYLKEGYQAPMPGKLRFTAHSCLPTTFTFVARVRGEVVATLSLIVDGALGMPLEKEFGTEVARLREDGAVLAEVSCLATRRLGDRPVLLHLMKSMYAFARHSLGITDCCIAIHPRQRRFYERVFLFESIGDERDYGACGKAPAVAMRMALSGCEARMASAHRTGMVGRFFLDKQDYVRMARGIKVQMHSACKARYRFMRRQWRQHALSAVERKAIVGAFASLETVLTETTCLPRLNWHGL